MHSDGPQQQKISEARVAVYKKEPSFPTEVKDSNGNSKQNTYIYPVNCSFDVLYVIYLCVGYTDKHSLVFLLC